VRLQGRYGQIWPSASREVEYAFPRRCVIHERRWKKAEGLRSIIFRWHSGKDLVATFAWLASQLRHKVAKNTPGRANVVKGGRQREFLIIILSTGPLATHASDRQADTDECKCGGCECDVPSWGSECEHPRYKNAGALPASAAAGWRCVGASRLSETPHVRRRAAAASSVLCSTHKQPNGLEAQTAKRVEGTNSRMGWRHKQPNGLETRD
jgi:hypothetical protein